METEKRDFFDGKFFITSDLNIVLFNEHHLTSDTNYSKWLFQKGNCFDKYDDALRVVKKINEKINFCDINTSDTLLDKYFIREDFAVEFIENVEMVDKLRCYYDIDGLKQACNIFYSKEEAIFWLRRIKIIFLATKKQKL